LSGLPVALYYSYIDAAPTQFRRNSPVIKGILLGFSVYHSLDIANYALAEKFGRPYGGTFGVVGPLAFVMGLMIWTLTLWRYEPALPVEREIHRRTESGSERLHKQLQRYDSELTRLFRR
jgi:hypothetical protein